MTEPQLTANTEYYKAFYYVAKLGSITAAATYLCLTQPTVTNTIHRLEAQLGTTLFIRNKRGVRLTGDGKILWNRVEPAMKLLFAGERDLIDSRNVEGGSLRIVTTEMSCRTYIIPNLEYFTQDHPKVKIQFRNALTENILDMVRNGETDLAILHTPFQATDDLALRYLDTIEECFVCGPRYKFLADQVHSLAALTQYPLISLPEGATTKQYIVALFEHNGLVFEPDIEITTIELVIQAVEHNFGIGTLPVQEAAPRIEKGTMFRIPVSEPPMERHAYVITSKNFPISPAAQVFLDDYLFWDKS